MTRVCVSVGGEVSSSIRARQLGSLFDIPPAQKQQLTWDFDAPYDDGRDWNIGLIVGPSGCGKSTILRQQFGEPDEPAWHDAPSVIDGFDPALSMRDIADVCQAVGFNTIPAWLRPYEVLSNGERFRADLARVLIEAKPGEPVCIDEFTSVVDRQVAKIGAHAVAKYARRHGLRVVLASCHFDILDWLQPDWVIEPAAQSFTWRSVQPRPRVDVDIGPIDHGAWKLFAPYHYLDASLHRSARCFAAYIDGRPVAFAGVMYRPHPKRRNIYGISRVVTLPDWQGLGLAFALLDTLGAAYRAIDMRLHMYPAHPGFVRSFDRSPAWQLERKPGYNMTTARGPNASVESWRSGARPCATFRYIGPSMPANDAARLMSTAHERLVRESLGALET